MTDETTGKITDSAESSAAIVEKFLYALRDKDFQTVGTLLDDDLVYENVGFPTIRGSRRAMKLFSRMQRPSIGFDVKFQRIVADGESVLTERTDALIFGRVRMNFWACGVFEVHDGRIALWRDYIDVMDFTKALARGVAGAFVPSLQRDF